MINSVFGPLATIAGKILSPFCKYTYERRLRKESHDQAIYQKLSNIISDEQFQQIKSYTANCEFPDLFSAIDGYWSFTHEKSNEFIDAQLQNLAKEMSEDLTSLAQLYAFVESCDRVGDGRWKLLANKSINTESRKEDLIKENKKLRDKFIRSHDKFRRAVKETLFL